MCVACPITNSFKKENDMEAIKRGETRSSINRSLASIELSINNIYRRAVDIGGDCYQEVSPILDKMDEARLDVSRLINYGSEPLQPNGIMGKVGPGEPA